MHKFIRIGLWALFLSSTAMAENVIDIPYGMYEIGASEEKPGYRLVITEDASFLTTPGAYLMEIPKNCGQPSVSDPVNSHISFLRPAWNPAFAEFTARGATARDANNVFVKFLDPNRITGQVLTTNYAFLPAIDEHGLKPIPFVGTRLPYEQELQKQALTSVLSHESRTKREDAQGIYDGALPDGTRVRLTLNMVVDHTNIEHWASRLDVGQYVNVPFGSNAPTKGLLRLVRFPGLDPKWTSGITGTVVTNSNNIMEFHGFYFVVRTGCVNPLHLKKVVAGRNR